MSDRHHNGGPSYVFPVWNGIFDHRREIGPAIWVFLWCIDRITDEESGVGIVLGGSVVTAEKIASELKDCDRTVRRHLERLSKRYIGLKRTPHGFIITVLNSRKRNIWRADRNVRSENHTDRTKMPVRSDKSAGQTAISVRSNKEDTAVDTAVNTAERQNKNLPPTFLRGVSEIWQQVSFLLKDDYSSSYVNVGRFQECVYDKYFRDAWLVDVDYGMGIAMLSSSKPGVLCEGIEKHRKRLVDTFRRVVPEVRAVMLMRTGLREASA